MFLQDFIADELIYALAWTIVHSIWQALAVGLGLSVVLHFTIKQSADVRYWLSNGALLLVLGISIFTFLGLFQAMNHPIENFTITPDEGFVFAAEELAAMPNNLWTSIFVWLDGLNQYLDIIASCWFFGVLFFFARLAEGFVQVHRYRTQQLLPIEEHWQTKFNQIAAQLGIRKSVQLLESGLTQVPMMVGHLKPLVLLPIGTVNHLPPDQVEAILAHELAHIARNDYLLNLIQSLIEVFFFFNPSVWWISANIRLERENCCDDAAVALSGNSLAYVKALVSLEELQNVRLPRFALAFWRNKNQLLTRVQRILNHPQSKTNIMEKFTATCLLLLAIGFFSFNNRFDKDNVESELPEIAHTVSLLDTIPNVEGEFTLTTNEDGKPKIRSRIKDGVIQTLKIDGRTIPRNEFSSYEGMIEELLSEAPIPPIPPSAPPALDLDDFPSAPPAPPAAPPAPPAPPKPSKNWTKIRKVSKGGRTTQLIIEEKGQAPRTIDVGEDDNISIHGISSIDDDVILIQQGTMSVGDEVVFEKQSDSRSYTYSSGGGPMPDIDIDGIIANAMESLEGLDMDAVVANALAGVDMQALEKGLEAADLSEEEVERVMEEMEDAYEYAQSQYEEAMNTYQEDLEVYYEELERSQEHAQEKHERTRERHERIMERKQEQFQRQHERRHAAQTRALERKHEAIQRMHEERHRAHQEKQDDIREVIGEALEADGIINDAKKFKFFINKNSMKVNGKVQPKGVLNRYTDLVEDLIDGRLSKGDYVEIKLSPNNSSISININD